MSVTLETATRNAACDAIVDLIDAGSTDAQGDLVIMTAAEAAVLCTINLASTSFGAASSGVATMANVSAGTATGDGVAATAKFQNRDNTKVLGCAVAASGSDINLSNTTIATDDTIQMTDGATTFTVPAS